MKRSLWVVLLLGAACARQGAIPGGPPDRVAPIVIETRPGPMEVLEAWREPVLIRFNERISERATGGSLEDAVLVSPEIEDVRVRHRRDGLEVTAPGGFPPGRVYRVTVQTMISDLFGNTLREPFELVFSTGPDPVPTVVAGTVVDRITGSDQQVRVDAVSEADSTVYPTRSDRQGIFALRFLPPGRYRLRAFEDRNRNGTPDFSEPQAVTTALLNQAGDTAIYSLEVLEGDSTAARVTSIEVADSVTLEVNLDDYLDPDLPLNTVRVGFRAAGDTLLPTLPAVARVLHPHQREALLRERAAALDTTANAAPTNVPVSPLATRPGSEAPSEPRPAQSLFVETTQPLPPGTPIHVEIQGVVNINRIPLGGGEATVVREVVADTAVADSARVLPDSAGVFPPDSAAGPPDTAGFAADTTIAGTAVPGPPISPDSLARSGPDSLMNGDSVLVLPPDTAVRPDSASHAAARAWSSAVTESWPAAPAGSPVVRVASFAVPPPGPATRARWAEVRPEGEGG